MDRTTIITSLATLMLLFSQFYWLRQMYITTKEEQSILIQQAFAHSIELELMLRIDGGSFKDSNNPKYTIRYADEMSPEERKSLKGDTIELAETMKNGIARTMADIITQQLQDSYMNIHPINLERLDSLFQIELQKNNIHVNFYTELHNEQKKKIKSTALKNQNFNLATQTVPLGLIGKQFVQAFIFLQPLEILQHMLYSLIISFLLICIIIRCLYYQLKVIYKSQILLQEKEQTVHTAIHDLKAPLNATYSILDYIAMKETDERQKPLLQAGKAQVRKLTDIIESMLDAHKKKQNVEIKKTEVCLPELIGQVNQEVALLFPGKKYEFKLNNPVPIHYIYTDPARLERCLRNLLENALKYSDDGVRITVTLSGKDGLLSIAIRDTGWGIPQKAQKKLGKQFYRNQAEGKKVRPGYGLGLCSVKLLVGEMNGSLTFQSVENAGSTFVITLPNETADKGK